MLYYSSATVGIHYHFLQRCNRRFTQVMLTCKMNVDFQILLLFLQITAKRWHNMGKFFLTGVGGDGRNEEGFEVIFCLCFNK